MAVFLVNNCVFPGCGMTFETLSDLIQHIEDVHIDTNPNSVEIQERNKPERLNLSYVLRYYSDAAKREQLEMQKKHRMRALSPAVSLPESRTPTESEVDDESVKSDNDDSDDSWTTQEDFPSDVILNMMGGRERSDTEGDRPYSCPVPGCKKRYKNVNGIKYHARHGHKNEATKVKKNHKCPCGKSYRTAQGLRNHTLTNHPTTIDLLTPPSQQLTLTHNLFTSGATLTPAVLANKDSSAFAEVLSLQPAQLSLGGHVASITSPRIIQHKLAGKVKNIAMAASNSGDAQIPATLALPIGTPVRFVSQASTVPIAVRSVKLNNV